MSETDALIGLAKIDRGASSKSATVGRKGWCIMDVGVGVVSRICDVRRVQQKRNKSCVRHDGQPSCWSRSAAKKEVGKRPRYKTTEMKLDNGGVNNRE